MPSATEVLFAVRPGPEQLDAIMAFSEAAGMDRVRSNALLADILVTARRVGITQDCGIEDSEDEEGSEDET